MIDLLKRITDKKERLDTYRPLSSDVIKNLEEWFKVELTYTSNAIEGNTLTRSETALVVEKGITVKGKTLKEHLEAINHAEALDYIKGLVRKARSSITEPEIKKIHWLILKKIDDENAGIYRTKDVRIAGANIKLPSHMRIPELMYTFVKWLHRNLKDHPAKIAADAHYKLVTIHPFVDGNGRTARLLLNVLLMQRGYPPALILKKDRKAYIDSLSKAQTRGLFEDYYTCIYKAIDRSLEIYLKGEGEEAPKSYIDPFKPKRQLLKIGELAQETGEATHTIRYWTKQGLLASCDYTKGGYHLYDRAMIKRVKQIRRLADKKRLRLSEIRERLST